MAANDTASMALFCDFENIALGVRDAQYEKFDIRPVLERLLAKGSIVVKKAYCDWERYKGFKAAMHEANFELIEIPHVRQSGKNSADIRMVVDALDLCYTKSHVDTFVIISGDSDFSPLVSKLRENAKKVIGVGVKQSCSDLLVTNCDEFIYYDDLVRDREAGRGQRREREKRTPEEEAKRSAKVEERKAKAIELVAATFADLMADRGEAERIWASVLKEVVKRRNPGFSESYYGFRTFGNLLEEAAGLGLLVVGRDDKSGTYVTRARAHDGEAPSPETTTPEVVSVEPLAPPADASEAVASPAPTSAAEEKPAARRRGGRRTRKENREEGIAIGEVLAQEAAPLPVVEETPAAPAVPEPPAVEAAAPVEAPKKAQRGARRTSRKRSEAVIAEAAPAAVPAEPAAEAPVSDKKPARKPGRSRKARKSEEGEA
ncbi:NYN domain-containing protein [Azonexus sp.]|uniref:NYN domain-containing protein n=1 Tax=Azonexus sp. TaxID=1872668 RepID=UPI0035B4168F